jgi:hypothetical protein
MNPEEQHQQHTKQQPEGPETKDDLDLQGNAIAVGAAVGLSLGASLGAAFGDTGTGTAIGLALGCAAGFVMENGRKKPPK